MVKQGHTLDCFGSLAFGEWPADPVGTGRCWIAHIPYAIVEADRNVRTPDQRTRLYRLVQLLQIVDEPHARYLPATVRLPSKDVPILLAAIKAGANYLLTGDKEHFGPYFGRAIEGGYILRPRDYLAFRRQRE